MFCHSCLAFFCDSNINFLICCLHSVSSVVPATFFFSGLVLSLSSVRPECTSVYHSCPINRTMLSICEMFRDFYLVLNGYLVLLCIHSMTTTFTLLIFHFFFLLFFYQYNSNFRCSTKLPLLEWRITTAVTCDPWFETRSYIFSVVRKANNVWLN
jgi:hypothetical protein